MIIAADVVATNAVPSHLTRPVGVAATGDVAAAVGGAVDQALSRPGAKRMDRSFRQVFPSNFHVTTSGNFFNPALICTMMEMGIVRILFAIDFPFVANEDGMAWIPHMTICEEDKVKLLSGNAKRLLKI